MPLSRRVFSSMTMASLLAGCRRGPAGVAGVIAAPPASVPERGGAAASPSGYAALRGFCDGVPAVSPGEYAARVQRVAAAVKTAGLNAVVLEPGPNMLYLAGVRWGRSERPFLCVLRSDGTQAWVCPAFEQRSAEERLPPGVEVLLWNEHEDPFALVAGLTGVQAKLAVDSDARGFIYAGILRHVSGAVVDDGPIASVRLRKTTVELDRIRRANEATKAAIAAAALKLEPGMTQSAFAAELTAAQEAAGLEQVWCLALFGPAASFPHGTEENRMLAEDDVVLVDTGG
ncbi:MAG: M24 family metallopeptidase, partial [Nannocystaceae bacterium]|nr:M24 family metallopeptidase [Nannocystaceae bacterium]